MAKKSDTTEAANGQSSALAELGEFRDIDLVAKWYQAEARAEPITFVPLVRSDNLQERFKLDNPSFVWACKLLAPYPLSRDREPIDGQEGDTFLMFEPSQPGVQSLIAAAAKRKLPVQLFCDGKKKQFLKSLGRNAELWQWRARIGARPIDVSRGDGLLLLPQAVAAEGKSDEEVPF